MWNVGVLQINYMDVIFMFLLLILLILLLNI
jgi:hypothetical protein